jgi:hypothetical protein
MVQRGTRAVSSDWTPRPQPGTSARTAFCIEYLYIEKESDLESQYEGENRHVFYW